MYSYVLEKGRATITETMAQQIDQSITPGENEGYHLREETKQFERIGLPFTSCLEEIYCGDHFPLPRSGMGE